MNRFDHTPLAIVGLGLRLPGANSPDAFWEMLLSKRQAMGVLPAERLDRDLYFQQGLPVAGKTYTEIGGVVPGDAIDMESLGLSPQEIHEADHSHLFFLQVALDAVRSANLDPDGLTGERLGVFVGHAGGSDSLAEAIYAANIETVVEHLRKLPQFTKLPGEIQDKVTQGLIRVIHERFGGADTSINLISANAVAELVARRLGTTGPALAVDAACASSFAALDMASRLIHAQQIDAAIVGGCSWSQWSSLVLFAQARALSAVGSFPFDARASGFVSSDGFAAVMIEPLARAQAAGRRVLAVVRSIGASCDGRGKSLWAPLQAGQMEAIRRAYRPGLDPSTVQVIESHTTSTKLGDATEIASLSAVFGENPPAKPILISSVKGNIGHTREAAGIASLIKMVLMLDRGIVPPEAGFQNPSPEINWSKTPFVVPTEATPWPERAGVPRRGALESLGIGGLNYHVVVEGAPGESPGAAMASVETNNHDRSMARPSKAIAIVGLGTVLPDSSGLVSWRKRLGEKPNFCESPADRWSSATYLGKTGDTFRVSEVRGGFIRDWQFDWRRFKVPPKQVEGADPLQFMLIDAVDQALTISGLEKPSDDLRRRTSVYVGSAFGGDFTSEVNIGLRLPEFRRDLMAQLDSVGVDKKRAKALADAAIESLLQRFPNLDEGASYSPSTLSSRIAKYFDFMGPCCSIDGGEASSFAALAAGVEALRAGDCDAAVVCGGQRTMNHTCFANYERAGRLAGEGREGFFLAEGVVAIVLRRLEDAEKAGEKVLAVIHEVAGAYRKDKPWLALADAIHTASERTKVEKPALVGYASATGNDALAEHKVVAEEIGDSQTLKAAEQVGMTQGASGLVSLAHLLAIAADRYPTGSIPNSLIPAAVNSVAYRGMAFHLILEANPQAFNAAVPVLRRKAVIYSSSSTIAAAFPASSRQARIVRLLGDSPEQLQQRINAAAANPQSSFVNAAAQPPFFPKDSWRLAVVAESPDSLAGKLKLVREVPVRPEVWPALHEQGVFVHQRPVTSPGVAFAFCGQASQYGGMLKGLVADYPETHQLLDEIDQVLFEIGEKSFAEIAWNEELAAELGHDTWLTQISIYAADLLVHRALQGFKITPQLLLGHSYGEYPALTAAGAWTVRTGILATRARCKALATLGDSPGRLVSTSAGREEIQRLQELFSSRGFVAPANFNSPEQTVLAVENAILDDVVAALEATGEVAKVLPVPQPYHSPLLAKAAAAFTKGLAGLEIRPPRIPLLSGVGVQYLADPEDIRRRLVAHNVEPLPFIDVVERAWRDGAGVFIEVGPRQVLTRLVRSILKGKPVVALYCDHTKVPAYEQFLRVQAVGEVFDLIGKPAERKQERAAQSVLSRVLPYDLTRQLPPPLRDAIPFFDATTRRRTRLAAEYGSEKPAEPSIIEMAPGLAEKQATPPGAQTDFENVLIKFVCEQTGYPPEVVTLDQDLEADLGIDSIKKAQFLGELREQYNIPLQTGAGPLSLSGFVTLRDIARFIESRLAGPSGGVTRPVASATLNNPPVSVAVAVTEKVVGFGQTKSKHNSPHVVLAPGAADVRVFVGSPYEMGKAHGEWFGDSIHEALARYSELVGSTILEREEVKRALSHRDDFFDREAQEEVQGIADGCGLPFDHIAILNLGLDPNHGMMGCTQLAIRDAANFGAGMLLAGNEDSPIVLHLGNTLRSFVQVRMSSSYGDGKIPCCLFGTTGEFGGTKGFNAQGLLLSSTTLLDQQRNLRDVGQLHMVLMLRILEGANNIDDAVEILRSRRRLAAWSVLLADVKTDQIAYLEYDGERFAVERDLDFVCTTNHSRLLEPNGEIPEHSRNRLKRAIHMLDQRPIVVDHVKQVLRDRYDHSRNRKVAHSTMNTVCRVDNQISYIMNAALPLRLFVTPGRHTGDHANTFNEFDPARWWGEQEVSSARHSSDRMMRRWVMRSELGAPRIAKLAPEPVTSLPTLVVGEAGLADAIAKGLGDMGSTCVTASASQAWEIEDHLADYKRLVITTASDDHGAWFCDSAKERKATLQRHALAPFGLIQRWIGALREKNELTGAELVAVTTMGGDFGFSAGRELRPAGGALDGLSKALARELNQLRVKVLDVPVGEPPLLVAKELLAELGDRSPSIEAAYAVGRRHKLRLVNRELCDWERQRANLTAEFANALTADSAWIITGGGRGITSRIVKELGRRFGMVLHLIGTTPRQNLQSSWLGLNAAGRRSLRQQVMSEARSSGQGADEAWRNVERSIELHENLANLDGEGVQYVYHVADVSDAKALARVLTKIRAGGMPIRGILHAAGRESAIDFNRKNPEMVRSTLESKVLGLQNLVALTTSDPIAAIIAFGSMSGRFGGVGQADYSMANELLAKLIASYRHTSGVRATTMVWPAWAEIGMAMRPESRLTVEAIGLGFMSVSEGIEHLVREIEAGLPEGEVVILDHPERVDTDGIVVQTGSRGISQNGQYAVLDGWMQKNAVGHVSAEVLLDPRREVFLQQHQFDARPILPAVIAAEMLAEAGLHDVPPEQAFALENFKISAGLRFFSDLPLRATVAVAPVEGNRRTVRLLADFLAKSGRLSEPDREHVRGEVHSSVGAYQVVPDDVHWLAWTNGERKWSVIDYPHSPDESCTRRVYHGPYLRTLQRLLGIGNDAWGDLVNSDAACLVPTRPQATWRLPVALLDGCLVACGGFAQDKLSSVSLPESWGRLIFFAMPSAGQRCRLWLRLKERSDHHILFDFYLQTEHGDPVLRVENYKTVILSAAAQNVLGS